MRKISIHPNRSPPTNLPLLLPCVYSNPHPNVISTEDSALPASFKDFLLSARTHPRPRLHRNFDNGLQLTPRHPCRSLNRNALRYRGDVLRQGGTVGCGRQLSLLLRLAQPGTQARLSFKTSLCHSVAHLLPLRAAGQGGMRK